MIKFLTLEGNNSKQIHEDMAAVYGESASHTTVTRWLKEFKHGRNSLEVDPQLQLTQKQLLLLSKYSWLIIE